MYYRSQTPTPYRKLKSLNDLKPVDMYDPGMHGFIDDLFSKVKSTAGTAIKERLKKEIDEAQAKIESRLGLFLTTNQEIRTLRARALAQQNAKRAEVQSRAVSVTARADALLNQYRTIQGQAMNLGAQLQTLRTKLDTSEVFKMKNPMQGGTRVIELLNQERKLITSTVMAAGSVYKKINRHIDDVKKLRADVESLELYAQGKGVQAISERFGGGLTGAVGGALKPLAVVAGVGAALFFIGPRFLRR